MEGIKFEKVSFEEFKRSYLFYCIYERTYSDYGKEIADEEIRVIYDNIKLPKRSTAGSAGYDFFAPYSMTIRSGLSEDMFPTGIKVKMPKNVVLTLYTRSSLGFNRGIRLANTVGVVDSDYYNNENNEGQMYVEFYNPHRATVIQEGEKYMQGVFINYLTTEDDDTTQERVGGLGSTGK